MHSGLRLASKRKAPTAASDTGPGAEADQAAQESASIKAVEPAVLVEDVEEVGRDELGVPDAA